MASDCVPIPQMTTTSAEQRKTDRIPILRPVHLKTADGWEFTALCTDINLSGIGIDTDRMLVIGQRVQLEVKTSDGRQSSVPMMVLYRMSQHYGLAELSSLDEVLELLPIQG